MNKTRINIDPFAVGAGLLSVPVFTLLITSIIFLTGLKINPFIFPVSIIASLLLIYFITKKNIKKFLFSGGLFLLIILFSLFVSSLFYDYSWDGKCYHQEIITALKNGWNPIYNHHAPDVTPSLAICIDHYAKGLETIYAAVYSTMNNIEFGKSINFIVIFASAFLFFNFLSLQFSSLSFRKKIFLSAIFPLCTVAVNQLFTFYIDWSAYSLLLILIPSLINVIKYPTKFNFYVIGAAIFFLVTIKFNILFWVLFVLLFYFIYLVISKRYRLLKQSITISFISGLLGVFLAGFNPYITNTVEHKSPIYPFMGEGKRDLVSWTTPKGFVDKPREEGIIISLLSYPDGQGEYVYVFPSNLRKKHLEISGLYDSRVGGFGAFFGWILILSILLYCNRNLLRNKERKWFNGVLLLLFLSLFILPHGWWARFVPFFYAFPLIMLLYAEYDKNNIVLRGFKNVIYVLIILNISFALYYSIKSANNNKKLVDNCLEVLAESSAPVKINFGWNISFRTQVDRKGIKYEEMTEKTGTKLFGPPVYLDPEVFEIKNSTLIDKTKLQE